jgi:hypothetical protein
LPHGEGRTLGLCGALPHFPEVCEEFPLMTC